MQIPNPSSSEHHQASAHSSTQQFGPCTSLSLCLSLSLFPIMLPLAIRGIGLPYLNLIFFLPPSITHSNIHLPHVSIAIIRMLFTTSNAPCG